MASVVAIVPFSILIVVFQGSLESMARYGWKFLVRLIGTQWTTSTAPAQPSTAR